MSDQEQAAPAEAPKKSKKMLMIIVIALVVLAGGGAGAFFMLKGDSKAEAAAPKKGTVVVSIDDAVTINLADGHYLKLAFALQESEGVTEEVNTSEAVNIAINTYTGKTIEELSTEKGRNAIREEMLKEIIKAYTVEDTAEVMDIYYTQFVTQ